MDFVAIAIMAWVVIGGDWANQRQSANGKKVPPSSKWSSEWTVESDYGTLTNGNMVAVMRREKTSTLGSASDNKVTTETYYTATLLTPDGKMLPMTYFGGANKLGMWPNSNREKVYADDSAQAYWDNTGGSEGGPSGPVGPQDPQPVPPRRPSGPDLGGGTFYSSPYNTSPGGSML
jgi:hypothetical protein